jgi:hypothetical protein
MNTALLPKFRNACITIYKNIDGANSRYMHNGQCSFTLVFSTLHVDNVLSIRLTCTTHVTKTLHTLRCLTRLANEIAQQDNRISLHKNEKQTDSRTTVKLVNNCLLVKPNYKHSAWFFISHIVLYPPAQESSNWHEKKDKYLNDFTDYSYDVCTNM